MVDGIVIAAEIDGTVLGLDAQTGARVWTHALGDALHTGGTYLTAAPAIDDGEVFIGNEQAFVALEAATGEPSWLTPLAPLEPDFSTDAPVAIGGGLVVGTFSRGTGFSAWDRDTGDRIWTEASAADFGVSGSPLISDDTVYVVDAADEVIALDLVDGATRWKQKLDPAPNSWSYAVAGGPALADGVLVVPTLYGALVGLDASSGTERWRHTAAPSILRTTHYQGAGVAGFEGSPVIADGIVWAADTTGLLVALDLHSGAQLWQYPLGAPVLAGLAVADGWLVAATYDGTIHTLSVPLVARTDDRGGCCDTGRGGRGGVLLAAMVGLVLRRRRRASERATYGAQSPGAVAYRRAAQR